MSGLVKMGSLTQPLTRRIVSCGVHPGCSGIYYGTYLQPEQQQWQELSTFLAPTPSWSHPVPKPPPAAFSDFHADRAGFASPGGSTSTALRASSRSPPHSCSSVCRGPIKRWPTTGQISRPKISQPDAHCRSASGSKTDDSLLPSLAGTKAGDDFPPFSHMALSDASREVLVILYSPGLQLLRCRCLNP